MNDRTHRAAELAELIRNAPNGISRKQLADKLGLSVWNIRFALKLVRARGEAAPTYEGGNDSLWATPDRIDEIRERRKAEKKASKRAADREKYKRLKDAYRDTRNAQQRARYWAQRMGPGEIDAPIIKRIVPAHLAEPIRKTAPNSVWELAA